MSRRVTAVLTVALLLAIGMAVLGVMTANALRERDRAVRDGVLLGIAQELESSLRQSGPDGAQQVIDAFVRRHSGDVAGADVVSPAGIIARGGITAGDATESTAALGPSWREYAARGGRSPYAPGHPPFTLRLYPSATLAGHRGITTAVITVSTATAGVLFILALLAARGLLERERRINAEAEQRRLQLAALAGAGLAHRIRTPLGTIKGTAQLIESQQAHSPERARRIVDEATRIDGMIRRLLEFARPPEPQPERFDVVQLAREVASRAAGTSIVATGFVYAFADPGHCETALEELVANARAFDAGDIDIAVSAQDHAVLVTVRDHGPGLSIDSHQALEPYVTTRTDGIGLGLSIAHALMRANRGDLEVRNADGGGCIATLRIPETA